MKTCLLSRRGLGKAIALLVLALSFVFTSEAQAEPSGTIYPLSRPPPKISVLTFGPGDAAFLRFGHNAIRVVDQERKLDLVYNFGTFQFDNPFLILDFLTGKFKYWLSVSSFKRTVGFYRRANRTIIEQRLNLGPQTAHELSAALQENAKPENREYLYDYYRDNCSTRVRDAIDNALKGGLSKRFQGEGRMNLREHTLRATATDFWLSTGLDIAMGAYIDQPESRWGEMFLPEKLQAGLDSVVFSGVHGTATLVKESKTWYEAEGRSGIQRKPPDRQLSFLKAGTALGGLFAFFGWEAYRRRKLWARIALGVSLSVLGLVAGVLGLLFVGLWAFTNHQVAFANENILQCAPFAIALPYLGYAIARSKPRWLDWAYRIAFAAMVASALGLLAKVLPFMEQQNHAFIALFLPTWCGATVALYLMRLRSTRRLEREQQG